MKYNLLKNLFYTISRIDKLLYAHIGNVISYFNKKFMQKSN